MIMKKIPVLFFSIIAGLMLAAGGSCFVAHADNGKTAAQSPAGTGQAEQSGTSANSNEYVIGPEDVLDIFVWRDEQLTRTVPVRIDGMISLPLVNDIQAAGFTPHQLKETIVEKLKGYIDNPTVTVTVREANSYKIFVSGEVRTPGVQQIRSETTLVKSIIAAGGFTEWANKRKILIISTENGKEKRTWANYNKIIDGDIPDVIIKRGDTIIVK
jgi:polysaccharide export outer membrane protein